MLWRCQRLSETGDESQLDLEPIDLNPTDKSLQQWRHELDDWTWDLELANLDTTELDRAIEAVGDRNVWRLLDRVNYG